MDTSKENPENFLVQLTPESSPKRCLKKDLDLEIKVGEDSELLNLYSVITIDPAKNQHINAEGANKLMEWFTSDKTKSIIGEYGKKEFGMPLFIPEK